MSPAEQQTRIDLAACYRLCAFEAWDDLIYTHISATVPGEPKNPIITSSILLAISLMKSPHPI
ncbi:MAG: hypothetical protein RL533_1067 [Pseudomonadota bacterium]